MLSIILKREWLRLRPSIFSILLFSIVIPIILYIVIGFSLYSVTNTIDGMKYMYWIAPGIWIFMSSLLAYLISLNGINSLLNEKRQIEAFCNTPITNSQLLIAIILWSGTLAVMQWIISVLLISLLNNDFISSLQIVRIFIQTVPLIIFSSSLSILIGILINDKFLQLTFNIIYFIVLGFGFGCFIPITFFPIEIINLIKYIPITNLIQGAQSIAIQNPGSFTGGLFTFIFAIIFVLISFGLSKKKFKE